jgi:predicted dehydrogenase
VNTSLTLPDGTALSRPPRPITAITLGAGARGVVYGNFARAYPSHLRIVGVADPVAARRDAYAAAHGIAPEACFAQWREVFTHPRFADAVIVSTPDHLHAEPCLAALAAGYDVLLEKPIAPTEHECRAVLAAANATDRIVAVCHVLRYAPYFQRLRTLLQDGAIGTLIGVQHQEPIEHTHMAHSYVRGQWRRADLASPIILAKCSHDLDILRWLVDTPTEAVHAFGARSWFRAEHAPAGSTERCADGCAVERTCPYSAVRQYLDRRDRLYVFDLPADEPARTTAIAHALATTDYGRCVYRLDNDQCDHLSVNLQYAGGVTASFRMDAFTPAWGRQTRLMGSHGLLDGDMTRLVHHDFRTGDVHTWISDAVDVGDATTGHGGGDWRLVADFVDAVVYRDPSRLTSSLAQSIESHLVAFACERSRVNGTVERITHA